MEHKLHISKRPTELWGLLYPGRITDEFDQRHATKNQPITVLVLLSESLGI